jgi:hypothetical protein
MKPYLIIVGLILASFLSKAQDFEDFYEHSTEVHLIKSVPGYTSFGFQIASGNVGMWKVSIEYTSLFIPDVIIWTLNTLTEKHPEKSNFTNIWGSLAIGVNVVSTKRFTVSAGGNITDYWTMANKDAEGGWYTAGTFVRADYLINDKFMFRLRNYLSKSFFSASSIWEAGTMVEGMPLFVKTGAELFYSQRVMGGVEVINQLSDPQYNTSRVNIRLGYRFSGR